MPQLDEQQRAFLESPFVGVATTLRPDGSPHSTIVWVDTDEEGVSFNTARGRAKPRHLEADPRIALLVVDPNDAYRWISISGTAELRDDGAEAQIDRLAKKYLGQDTYPWRQPGEQRVSVRIRPERIEGFGLDGQQ